MKVLVIPEDPTLDKYILKPIVERLFKDVGRKAQLEVLEDPHLRGIDEALDHDMVARIIAENPMVDLFLLMVDRDCNRFHNEERAATREQEHPGKLLACLAVQEVEVWMVALHREVIDAPSWEGGPSRVRSQGTLRRAAPTQARFTHGGRARPQAGHARDRHPVEHPRPAL